MQNKFSISFQYLKENVEDEVDFLHAEEHKGFLQINAKVLIRMVKYSQSSQNTKFLKSLQYLTQEVRDEVDFLHADKHHQVDFNTSYIKVSYKVILSLAGLIKHSQTAQSNKSAISLQYL